jgi:hypothetical protein
LTSSADKLTRSFEFDTFLHEYIKQIRPKKVVYKYYGVDPIRVVKCPMIFPMIVSFTYNEPLEHINLKNKNKTKQLFKLTQVRCRLADNFAGKNKFMRAIDDLVPDIYHWILNGIITQRNRSKRESIGFIDAVLGKSIEHSEEESKMYFMTPN